MHALDLTIREARSTDAKWVSDTMEQALAPYYDGDHRAHANRILDAHLSGGHDKLGFFSYEQKMFVAELSGVLAGVIHVVGKRQQTFKISPLIVSKESRGRYGLGKRLFEHAEAYARAAGARQLYCTVAEGNVSAMNFFSRHGFVAAGYSDSHYKRDSREVMMYKFLIGENAMRQRDALNISVLPFKEDDGPQVRQMLIDELPEHFSGVDDAWVDALFAGYHRRLSNDVNAKFKLIFVASDSCGHIQGVAAATPKKGTPIKLMPLIARSQVAFEALLNDLPHQLVVYGHKLYLHICPSVSQVLSLQRLGWKLDAAMPGAYRPEVVTQQWSIDLSKGVPKTLRVKRHFFDQVKAGSKTLEVRVGYSVIRDIQIGETLKLVTHDESFSVAVVDKRQYPTFVEMLEHEDYRRIVPDSVNSSETLEVLRGFYGIEKEKLGVFVLQFCNQQT